MTNFNVQPMIEEDFTQQNAANAFRNYVELSAEMNMPVLKVSDLLDDETETEYKSGNNEHSFFTDFMINQPMDDVEAEKEIEQNKLDELAQDNARMAVDKIEDEIHKFWTSKRFIRTRIQEINEKNVYSFIGYMITVSESGSALGDIRNFITINEIKHLTSCLMRQAKNAGLIDITQYKRLRKTYSFINRIWSSNYKKKLDKKTTNEINKSLEEMFEELTKIY